VSEEATTVLVVSLKKWRRVKEAFIFFKNERHVPTDLG
jgi:hypothetical protein